MLALVLLIEASLARRWAVFSEPLGLEWSAAARSARTHATQCEVLCFGDSLLKLGLLPKVIDRRTGLHSYNLALRGGQASSSAFLLHQSLDAGARPSLILVDFFPHLNVDGPRLNLDNWAYLGRLGEGAGLAFTAGDPELLGTFLMGRLLPSIRGRHPIRTACLGGLDGHDLSTRSQLHFVRNWRQNRGATVFPSQPEAIIKADPKDWYWIYRSDQYDEVNVKYIHDFLSTSVSYHIQVAWVVTPVVPWLQEWCERTGHDRAMTRILQSWQERFPGLIVIDGRHAGYEPGVFNDPVHLGRDGANVLSYEVGEIARRISQGNPATPRWIDLPRYRARTIDVPVEDVFQSLHAVREMSSEVRRR